MTATNDTYVDMLEVTTAATKELTQSDLNDPEPGSGASMSSSALLTDVFDSSTTYENAKFKCEDSVEIWMNLNGD